MSKHFVRPIKLRQQTLLAAIAAVVLTSPLDGVKAQPVEARIVLIHAHDGFTTISEEAFFQSFANGVGPKMAKVLYAVREPTAASLFGERTTEAAWHSKLDQTISPDLERFLAKRMNATTVEVDAGHLSLVSHPKEVADLILTAAGQRE
jgi:hypothetical protein